MPVITLPDGSQRQFDQPVTVHDVAADIGVKNDRRLRVKRKRQQAGSEQDAIAQSIHFDFPNDFEECLNPHSIHNFAHS